MKSRLLLLLLLLAWFLPGLTTGTLWRTEGLRGRVAQECFAKNWLIPTLYSQPYLTKPPGHYAAICLCSWPTGEVTDVTTRLPSILAGILTAWLLFEWLRHSINARAGLLAVMLFCGSLAILDKIPSAEIDPLLLFWVTASLACAWRVTETDNSLWLVLALMCVSAGTLTKWTAPVFFYLTVLPFWLFSGQLRRVVSLGHIVGLIMAIGLIAAWAAHVSHVVGWDVLCETVWREASQRVTHRGKPYPWLESLTFPLVVLAANLPASLFLRLQIRQSLTLFMHCWLWPNLLFWMLPAQHAARYVLPLTPALVLLAATELQRRRATTTVMALLALAVCIKFLFLTQVLPSRTARAEARLTGQKFAERVPTNELLLLCLAKDEGIMFYYGRAVMKVRDWSNRPPHASFAVLIAREWRDCRTHAELLGEFRDQQGEPLFLVRFHPER